MSSFKRFCVKFYGFPIEIGIKTYFWRRVLNYCIVSVSCIFDMPWAIVLYWVRELELKYLEYVIG